MAQVVLGPVIILGAAGAALIVGTTPNFSVNTSTGVVETTHNTLDDGSGNLTAIGTITGNTFIGEIDTATLDSISFSFTALSSGQVLAYNGTNWTNLTLTTGVSSVTNSDGSLTISPTTGNVVASLNVANANSWTAEQTFSAVNPAISLVQSTSGDAWIYYYNGTAIAFYNYEDFTTLSTVSATDTWTLASTYGGNHIVLNIQADSLVATANNTLDDGSGNATIAETLTVGSNSFAQSGQGLSILSSNGVGLLLQEGATTNYASVLYNAGTGGFTSTNPAWQTGTLGNTNYTIAYMTDLSTSGGRTNLLYITTSGHVNFHSIFSTYNNISLVNGGIGYEVAANNRAISTTATTITSYTPTATGQFLIIVSVVCSTAATLTTLTVTYSTTLGSIGSVTETLASSVSFTAGIGHSYHVIADANTTATITVSATANVIDRLYASAVIMAL